MNLLYLIGENQGQSLAVASDEPEISMKKVPKSILYVCIVPKEKVLSNINNISNILAEDFISKTLT